MRPMPTPATPQTPKQAPEPHRRPAAPPTLVHAALDDRTLLALILGRRRRDIDPEQLAAALLDRFGALGAVAGAEPGELARVCGAGTALVAYVRTAVAHEPREQFRALYLDRRNILLRDELVADGTVDHAQAYVATVVDCYLALTAGQGITSSTQCRPRGAGR